MSDHPFPVFVIPKEDQGPDCLLQEIRFEGGQQRVVVQLSPLTSLDGRALVRANLSEATNSDVARKREHTDTYYCPVAADSTPADTIGIVVQELFMSHIIEARTAKEIGAFFFTPPLTLSQRRGGDEYKPSALHDANQPVFEERHEELRQHLMQYTLWRNAMHLRREGQKLGLI